MRDLFSQSRPLSAATIRQAITLIGILFVIAAIIIVYNGLKTIFSTGAIDIGLLQITLGLGLLMAVFLLVRLQAETVLASHRANDRLMVLSDAISAQRQTGTPNKASPRKTTAKAKSTTKKSEPKPTADANDADG